MPKNKPVPPKLYANSTEALLAHRRIAARIRPSRPWVPLVLDHPDISVPTHPDAERKEHWYNDLYQVMVFRFSKGWPWGGGEWVKLGISCQDGEPRHDWREFQKIKNQLCGDEWGAVELYPAESRLVDPSNYYYLWCAPNKLPIGLHERRRILGPKHCVAPQRGWAPGEEPPDIDERAEEFQRRHDRL